MTVTNRPTGQNKIVSILKKNECLETICNRRLRAHDASTGIKPPGSQPGSPSRIYKKRTIDKTLESTLKASINTTLPTCDDKGAFTDDDDTYRKHK